MLNVSDKHYFPLPTATSKDEIEDNPAIERARLEQEQSSQRERIESLLSTMGHEPPKKKRA